MAGPWEGYKKPWDEFAPVEDAPFAVYYHLLSGPADGIEQRAKNMGFEFSPDFSTISRGDEVYRYDPDSFTADVAGSARGVAQMVGGTAGGLIGAPGGPVTVGAGAVTGGVLGGEITDFIAERFEPSGGSLEEQARQTLHDVATESAGVGLGEAIPYAAKSLYGGAKKGVDALSDLGRRKAQEYAKQADVAPEQQGYQDVIELLRKKDAEGVAPEVRPDMQVRADAEEMGIDLIPSHYSKNETYKEVEQALKSKPGSILNQKEVQAISDLGDQADTFIIDAGGELDKAFISQSIKDRFGTVVERAEKAADVIYKKVNDAIPNRAQVEPKNTLEYLNSKAADLGGVSRLSPSEKRLHKLFSDEKNRPTYALLDRERRSIGRGYKKEGVFKDAEKGDLDQLYRVLTEDQQNVAKSFNVGDEYAAARKVVSGRKDIEQRMAELYGKDLTKDLVAGMGGAIRDLSKGSVSKFVKMVGALPKNMRGKVVATSLNELFNAGARNKGSLGQGFVSAWEGLSRNKLAKDMLLSNLPKSARSRLDSIYRVSKGIYSAKKYENTSGTARALLANWDKEMGALAKIYSLGRRFVTETAINKTTGQFNPHRSWAISNTIEAEASPATQAADRMLASPKFREAIDKYAKGAVSTFEDSAVFKNWVKAQGQDVQKAVGTYGFFNWLIDQE